MGVLALSLAMAAAPAAADHVGRRALRFEAGGPAFGNRGGPIWFDAADGYVIDAWGIPNHSELRDFRLRLTRVSDGGEARVAAPADRACRKLPAAMKRARAFLPVLLLAACARAPEPAPPSAPRFATVAGQSQVQHGERLARVLGCTGCHGQNLQGQPWNEEADLAISFSSNLPQALPAYSDATLERAIRGGVRADGTPLWDMPSEIFTGLDPADMAALIAFLRTQRPAGPVHPRIAFGPRGRREVAAGTYRPAPQLVQARRGQGPARFDAAHDTARYMIRATCGECHGVTLTGDTWPNGERSPPDLNVVAGYSREDFRRLMRTGVATGGRQVGLMSQVARGRFVHFTDAEVDAIYDYLAARARR